MPLLYVCHQINSKKSSYPKMSSWYLEITRGILPKSVQDQAWLGDGKRLEWNSELFPPILLEVSDKARGGQLWQARGTKKIHPGVMLGTRGEQGTGTQLVILDAVEKEKRAIVFPSRLKVERYGQPTSFSLFEITTYLQIVSNSLLKTNMQQIWSQCGPQLTSSFTRGFVLWSGKTLLN